MKTLLATIFTVSLLAMPAMAETQMPVDETANGNYVLPMQPDYNPSVWGETATSVNVVDSDNPAALNEIAPAAGDAPTTKEMKTMMEDFEKSENPSVTGKVEGDADAAPYLKAF